VLHPSLWDSYNFSMSSASKTYARNGTSATDKWATAFATPKPPGLHRSFQMLDVLMIAMGLAFFAAAIGYTYACERL
jgi:hypothetical protein